MIRRPPPPRPGITLTEVLVALFVMALGLISLLTLFPLGAVRLAQALRDDRCTQTVAQADAYLRAYWRRVWYEPATGGGEPALIANFNNANAGSSATPAVTSGSGYPVLVDPIGYNGYASTPLWKTVAGVTAPATPPYNIIPRQTFNGLAGITPILQACELLDDLTFQPNGTPDTSAVGGKISRGGKYHWAALLQLTNVANTSGSNATASCTILLFDGRPPFYPSSDLEKQVTNGVTANQGMVTLNKGATSITGIDPAAVTPTAANNPPLIRKGGWVLDGTPVLNSNNSATVPNSQFYRIVGLTLNPTTNLYDLDVDPAIQTTTANGTLYFFAGLAEVFNRNPLP